MSLVNGKKVVYSETLILGPNEIAVLSPPESIGMGIELFAKENFPEGDDPFVAEDVGGTARLHFPFTSNSGVAFQATHLKVTEEGTYSLRGVAQGAGQVNNRCMVVNINIFLQQR